MHAGIYNSNSPAKIWRALRSMFAKYVCEVCMFAKKVVVRVFAVGKVGYRKSLGSTRRSCIFNKVKKRNWR